MYTYYSRLYYSCGGVFTHEVAMWPMIHLTHRANCMFGYSEIFAIFCFLSPVCFASLDHTSHCHTYPRVCSKWGAKIAGQYFLCLLFAKNPWFALIRMEIQLIYRHLGVAQCCTKERAIFWTRRQPGCHEYFYMIKVSWYCQNK